MSQFADDVVTASAALAKKPWGALDFIIRDIDGNLLLFAGPAA
jgi:hypothetical protein